MITLIIGCGVAVGIISGFIIGMIVSSRSEIRLNDELVAALKAIVARAENPALCDDTDALLRNAHAAIQKAEPKQP